MSRTLTTPIDNNYVRVLFWMRGGTKSFTETHWLASPSTSLVDALTAANKLAKYRGPLLNSQTTIRRLRASHENVYKDSQNLDYDKITQGNQIPGTDAANTGNDCLRLLATSDDFNRKSIYLGGIPDAVIKAESWDKSGIAGYDTAMEAYIDALVRPAKTGLQWGFLGLNRDPLVCPRVEILTVVFTGGSPVFTVTCKDAHRANTNDIVRISLVPGADVNHPVNQLWMITKVSDTVFTCEMEFSAPAAATLKGGHAMRQSKKFLQYTAIDVAEATTRQRGARTFLPLGRRKIKRTVGY